MKIVQIQTSEFGVPGVDYNLEPGDRIVDVDVSWLPTLRAFALVRVSEMRLETQALPLFVSTYSKAELEFFINHVFR